MIEFLEGRAIELLVLSLVTVLVYLFRELRGDVHGVKRQVSGLHDDMIRVKTKLGIGVSGGNENH
jgi:hypothetical protein